MPPASRTSDEHARQPAEDFPIGGTDVDSVTGDSRDSVQALVSTDEDGPAIVSISDVHGYLDAARSALLTLTDHRDYEPVVEEDEDGRLHWAGNEYVLVFNGDLVDRGPSNVETLQMVHRLVKEAPAGRIRVTLGNHEMGILTPDLFRWGNWFSTQVSSDGRLALVNAIRDGHVVAAYEGYNVIYAHAGHASQYDIESVNDALEDAATQLHGIVGDETGAQTQRQIVDDNPLVLGMDEPHPKGPRAGLVWLDFRHLPAGAPPQIVGHTRHDSVTQKGTVLCENVIRNTIDTPGGESVLVETQDSITVLRRDADGTVSNRAFQTDRL
jgi:hypothetical protein